MRFAVLPTRHGGAAENMAADFMLLERYPDSGDVRFRHYGWFRPAFTFGYSQKIEFVRAQLPPNEERVELCRRPTGGGVVDHREDWTYSLVIPRGHPMEELRAIESYRQIHNALADAFNELGQPAALQDRCEPKPAGEKCGPGVCFVRPELYDVIVPTTGAKIAGAAQKRNKRGLLFQGSISRGAVANEFDWDAFKDAFVQHLGTTLKLEPQEAGWPDWSDDELTALTEQYATPEWNEFR
ncbi:MAG TPA: lipoate--protein ligase family protein [Opitutaceae bacterium]|nr:lipoate--protein ligase family protein [Opitutaceae bacterium]